MIGTVLLYRSIYRICSVKRSISSFGETKMSNAYVVGQITVKNQEKWAEYSSKVPNTLITWGAELVFRGKQFAALSGECPHSDIVVIQFPSIASAEGWHSSPAYQALIPLRQQAAEMVLLTYET